MMKSVSLLIFLWSARTVQSFVVAKCNWLNRIAPCFAYYDEQSPSDYSDVLDDKGLEVDTNEEDALIRDALKHEVLLLSSVTNRDEYASKDEQNMLVDLVAQLEALNPTPNPTENLSGEWDLCLSSTQFFPSSPFFQSLRTAAGETNRQVVLNLFAIHDRATTSGWIGRVRQKINENQVVSEVDLAVGGLPVRVKGTVITTASWKAVSNDKFEVQIEHTTVKGSNVPLLNQFLEDLQLEIPMKDIFSTLNGVLPSVPNKIFYLDAVEREGFLVGHLEAGGFDLEGLLEDDMRHSEDSL